MVFWTLFVPLNCRLAFPQRKLSCEVTRIVLRNFNLDDSNLFFKKYSIMVNPILRKWNFGDNQWTMGDFPRLMGIVNVTPDSFSDGGIHQSVDSAIEHALNLADQGADILDIGGESTRPGAEPVSEKQELERVISVIEKLSSLTEVPISIDTMKSVVAKEAIQAGAIIVNDVSGLEFDPAMPSVCAETNVGLICMHMKGDPQTMQDQPVY